MKLALREVIVSLTVCKDKPWKDIFLLPAAIGFTMTLTGYLLPDKLLTM